VNAHQTAMGASLALIALLVGGCATAAPPPSTAASESKSIKRCSPSDPDRHAWFCVVGQILYSILSIFQQDISSRLP